MAQTYISEAFNKLENLHKKKINESISLNEDWSKGIGLQIKVSTPSLFEAVKNGYITVGDSSNEKAWAVRQFGRSSDYHDDTSNRFDKLIGKNSLRFKFYDLPNRYRQWVYIVDNKLSVIFVVYYDEEFTYKQFGGKSNFRKAKLTTEMQRLLDDYIDQLEECGIKVFQSKVEVGGSDKFDSSWRQAQDYNEDYSVVDLDTGDRFGKYKSEDEAKGKAIRYSSDYHAHCAVVDDDMNVISGYNRSGKEIKKANESLSDEDLDSFKSDIFNALADIAFNYRDKDLELDDFDKSYNDFVRRFFDGYLTEDISDEDKHDSDILRKIYDQIQGKQFDVKKLSQEEKDVLDKYNLDVWGFRGDSKMVTPKRRNVITDKDIYNRFTTWNGRKVKNYRPDAEKINFADKAKKVDQRDYGREVNNPYYTKRYNQLNFKNSEREIENKKLQKNVNDLKRELNTRYTTQKRLNNLEKDYEDAVKRADIRKSNKLNNIETDYKKSVNWSQSNQDEYDKKIQDLLNKHRKDIKEAIRKLNEAEMSPEDKHDSDLLRNIYSKSMKRSNAALTPEEKEVLKKYGIERNHSGGLWVDTSNPLIKYGERTPDPKINYADRARKIKDRTYMRDLYTSRSNYPGDPFKDSERNYVNDKMSQDVYNMKNYLYNRNYYKSGVENQEKIRDKSIKDVQDQYKKDVEFAKNIRDKQYKELPDKLKKANDNIRDILNRKRKNESLEDSERIISTGLEGKINHEILSSVIGQMSDGIWENTPGMEKYWTTVRIDDNNNIVVSNKKYDNHYYDKSDDEVRRFFANKIKTIAQIYLNDNNFNPYKEWREDNDELCNYLNYEEDVTIGDAYKAYKQLH